MEYAFCTIYKVSSQNHLIYLYILRLLGNQQLKCQDLWLKSELEPLLVAALLYPCMLRNQYELRRMRTIKKRNVLVPDILGEPGVVGWAA